MGMYTHLCLNASLKDDVPSGVVETLRSMVDGSGINRTGTDHKLFTTERWRWALTSAGAYHPGATKPVLRERWEGQADLYLAINTSIKNYDGEWGLFLDWIAPYCEEADGYYRHEEDDEVTPVRIYEGKIVQGPGVE